LCSRAKQQATIDTLPDRHILIFTLAYIAMVPCANLIGFAGQELSRKLPHVVGVLTEVTFGSIVEIVLFIVLLSKNYFYVIKAAILGSILATMLLCLGVCFFVGGLKRTEQTFSNAVSESGSGLLLTACVFTHL
jgi:Ca2+:H+ antiporter